MIRSARVRCGKGLMAKRAEPTRLVTDSPQSGAGELRMLLFPGIHGLGPILPEQTAQGAVGQHFAAGLAAGAVVDLIFGVADPLDRGATNRAGLAEAPVHRHTGPKRRYLLGEIVGGL